MSFLSETRTAGIALIILGVIQLIGGLAALVGAVTAQNIVVSAVIACIGPIIMAVLYFRFGVKVKEGGVSKINILAYFVRLAGLGMIITTIFSLWNVAETNGVGAALVAAAIVIILGLIILAISARINDGKQDTLDKVIWILLLVIFALSVIGNIASVIGIFTAKLALDLTILDNVVLPIVNLIIALFMLILLFDSDVKREMNM